MKKFLAVLVVIAFAIVMAQVADAAYIAGTKHNLASSNSVTNTFAGTVNEICIYCHTPHGGTQAAGQPLWNRVVTTATFNAYTSATLSNTVAPNGATNPASRVCFSCHDGVTSMNSLLNVNGAATSGGPTLATAGIYNIGGDSAQLANDHPVGMPIPSRTGYITSAGTLASFMVASAGGPTVECSTCHAVHGAGIPNLLRVSNAVSSLCLQCHDK